MLDLSTYCMVDFIPFVPNILFVSLFVCLIVFAGLSFCCFQHKIQLFDGRVCACVCAVSATNGIKFTAVFVSLWLLRFFIHVRLLLLRQRWKLFIYLYNVHYVHIDKCGIVSILHLIAAHWTYFLSVRQNWILC